MPVPSAPSLGLSVMPQPEFAAAALPLFSDGLIDAVEWSFDMGWGPSGTPDWLDGLLDDYAAAGQLLGHGVSFSLLAGDWSPHHEAWLRQLRTEVEGRTYRHVSEHLGFLGAGRFSFAAPLPMPFCPEVVKLGQERMALLADAAGCSVGLENLATSLGAKDGTDQGQLLDAILDPSDGFVVLDLHNLWCQAHNLELGIDELLDTYPLHRVRELHVSGGSWDDRPASPGAARRRVRRDTHDGLVPTKVSGLLREVAPRCPALEVVVYERLGTALIDPKSHDGFRDDVLRVAEIVRSL